MTIMGNIAHCQIALVKSGVAAHHAGLSLEDRKAVEELFAKKKIAVIVSTSGSTFQFVVANVAM